MHVLLAHNITKHQLLMREVSVVAMFPKNLFKLRDIL